MHTALLISGFLRQPSMAEHYYFTLRLPLVQGETIDYGRAIFPNLLRQNAILQPTAMGHLRTGLSPQPRRKNAMSWTTPRLIEVCVGLEINGYLPAEL
jgi:coenzyme PQQ precursor peptide PqqA